MALYASMLGSINSGLGLSMNTIAVPMNKAKQRHKSIVNG
jgi:hypothetical protein